MNKKILYVILIALSHKGFAQVANYDFFAFRNGNMFNVNPAWVTKGEGINVVVDGQATSSPVSYGYKNMMAGVYSGVGDHSGLGLKVISDSRGAFQVLRADLSYGFRAQFSEGHTLHLGGLMGINSSNLNLARIDNYELIDPTDPTLSSNYYNTTQFVAGAGFAYCFKDLEVSVSMPNIVSTSQPFNAYLNAAAFYKIKTTGHVTFQPWISYQNIPVTKSLVGGYVKAFYKDWLWLQTGYQNNKSVSAAFGFSFDNIGVAYGLRTSGSDFRQVSGEMHEITITVSVRRKPKNSKEKNNHVSVTAPLDEILSRLDNLLGQDITLSNKSELRGELERIKEMLSRAELDNSDPEKAKMVEKQLIEIEQKLSLIEQKLKG